MLEVLGQQLLEQLVPIYNMPFKLIKLGKNKGKYRSPSGKVWTLKQVKAYYATKGFKKKRKK